MTQVLKVASIAASEPRVRSLPVGDMSDRPILTQATDASISPVAPMDGKLSMLSIIRGISERLRTSIACEEHPVLVHNRVLRRKSVQRKIVCGSLMLLLAATAGCAGKRMADQRTIEATSSVQGLAQAKPPMDSSEASLSLVSHQTDATEAEDESSDPTPPDQNQSEWDVEPIGVSVNQSKFGSGVAFEDVIKSVHQSYPLVEAAYLERQIANGNQFSAWGNFDTKLKAASENGPLGFYETYRNSAGFTTPIYGGGEFFGGYRNGGGDFQPWYQERETNDGGEFKGGVRVPLMRDRDIDSRRADLWRATYDQQIADPVIRMSLVQFSRDAGVAYWKWVAAGQKNKLGQQWLDLAAGRNAQIKRRVELQDLDPPELTDNQRAIAKREAKLADSRRVLQQSAAKLSLFLRDDNGAPYTPSADELVPFPPLLDVDDENIDRDIARAQQNRPELQALALQLKRLRVDYSEASNMTRPGLDAQIVGSQDVGEPTSKKRDKSEFELEAALFFDVPLQRRKGRGKMQAVQAKISQVSAKRRLVQDKIAAEVKAAYAGLIQSRQEALKAREAVKLATRMADVERRKFEVGQSDLLKVALREQYSLEAAEEEISATHRHFTEFTNFEATLANDRPNTQ